MAEPDPSADSFDPVGEVSLNVGFGPDCGVLGRGVDVTQPNGYGVRPVKNDDGALVALLFGRDADLEGDVEELAEAVLKYQSSQTVQGNYSKERLGRLSLCWVDVPAVIPVCNRSIPDDNRMKSTFYAGIPSFENVTGLFFSSSANINYMMDAGIDITSADAKKYGLYVPIATCPRGA